MRYFKEDMMSFIIDKMYKDNDEYPISGSYLEKFLFYRAAKDDIDIDVCKYIIETYIKTNPIFIDYEEKTIVNQNGSENKYEIHADGEVFRGETFVNCMQVLLQIANYSQLDNVGSNDIDEIKERILNSDIVDNKLLEEFIYQCYSEGNFLAIPYKEGKSLNRAKGRLKKAGYNYIFLDNPDTYLKVLTEYFKNGTLSCSLVKLIDKEYPCWKNRYRASAEGVECFIKDNNFEAFYCGTMPVQFWNISSKGIKYDMNCYLQRITAALKKRKEDICN